MSFANNASLVFAVLGSCVFSIYEIGFGDLEPLFGPGIFLVLAANLFFIFNFKNGLYALLLAFYFISTWGAWVSIGSDVFHFSEAYCVAAMLVVPIIFIVLAMRLLKRKKAQNVSSLAYVACIFSTALFQFVLAQTALSGI